MEPVTELTFAGLLRQLRAGARLTQEELAEAAGLSPRSISDLERGINRTARKDTAAMLADALSLPNHVRALFVEAARGRRSPAEVLTAERGVAAGVAAAATRALPRDIGTFTGRDAELARLAVALGDTGGVVGICAIDGMAGIGKTTLAVHAAHRLAERFPDGQFFLSLRAHAAGQRPVDPADALASLLMTAGVGAHDVPSSLAARANRWRDEVAGKKILLVLDDAVGHEQVRPLLPGTGQSLTLITSRRRLAALEDAAVISIDTLAPHDAVALLVMLTGRDDLTTDSAAAQDVVRLCGYLPLAIGMLARQLRHHPVRTGVQLAGELVAARDRLAVMSAENLSVAAAFELSYRELSAVQQQLFRRLGLVPGTDIDAYAAAALDDISPRTAAARLDELYDQHLLAEPAAGRYVMHDLLREYAAALAAADDPAATGPAIERLLDYYAHVAVAAGRHIATWTTAGDRLPPGRAPRAAPPLDTSEDAAEWLERERPNLYAAVGHAADTSPQHAIAITSAMGGFLRARGHWGQAAELYQTALAAASAAGDRTGQAGALDELGLLQQLTGDYPAAAASLARAVVLYRELGDAPGEAYARNHLGLVQHDTGDYPAAAVNHQLALALARGADDRLAEAVSLTDLGLVQQLTGDYVAATASYERALPLVRSVGSRFDLADVLCELGAVQRETGDYAAAADKQHRALELFGALGDQLGQAWALHELGCVLQATGDYPAAAVRMEEALRLHRDLASRHGEAAVLNSLGELSWDRSDADAARALHTEALVIVRALGSPRNEARALEGIGRTLLRVDPAGATQHLQQALAIYQRLAAPEARRVQTTLDELSC